MTRRAVVLVALALTASGCGKLREKLFEKKVEQATGSKVTVDESGRVNLLSKDDAGHETHVQFGDGTSLPADFPKAVPIFPGAKVIAVVSMGRKDAYLVTLDTTAPAEDVSAYYKKNLKGFKGESDIALGKTRMLTLAEPGGLNVSLTITPSDDGKTGVQITTSR
jgi:hypothetical protein